MRIAVWTPGDIRRITRWLERIGRYAGGGRGGGQAGGAGRGSGRIAAGEMLQDEATRCLVRITY